MQASAAMRVARALALALLTAVLGCGYGPGPRLPPGPLLMGFAPMPPRLDPAIVVPSINYWLPRADAAIMHVSPPWAALIRGVSPAAAVDTAQLPLANYFRANRLALVFTVDATDGLNRAAEAPELVALGRSVTDTAIQRLYRDWVFAVADKLRPDYLGLIAETNLIRAAAPDSVYRALVVMANAVAAEVRAAGLPSRLYVSVQVETAWGRPATGGGAYQGIARDLADFPFVDAIGLSSYPYLRNQSHQGGGPGLCLSGARGDGQRCRGGGPRRGPALAAVRERAGGDGVGPPGHGRGDVSGNRTRPGRLPVRGRDRALELSVSRRLCASRGSPARLLRQNRSGHDATSPGRRGRMAIDHGRLHGVDASSPGPLHRPSGAAPGADQRPCAVPAHLLRSRSHGIDPAAGVRPSLVHPPRPGG